MQLPWNIGCGDCEPLDLRLGRSGCTDLTKGQIRDQLIILFVLQDPAAPLVIYAASFSGHTQILTSRNQLFRGGR